MFHITRTLVLAAACALAAAAGAPSAYAADNARPVTDHAVTADTNAALRYWRAWTLLTDEDRETIASAPSVTDENFQLTDELRGMLESEADTIGLLLEAAEMPHCDFGIDYDDGPDALLPHLAPMRMSFRLLALHGRERLDAGDTDGAVRVNAAMYRLAAHLRGDAVLISSLVSIAIAQAADAFSEHLQANAELDPAHLRTVCKAVALLPASDPANIAGAIRTEQRMFAAWFANQSALERTALAAQLGAMLNVPAEDAQAFGEDLIQALRIEDDRERARAVARLIDRYNTLYDLVLQVWNDEDRDARLEQLEERVAAGDFGPLAKVFAPSMSRIARNDNMLRETLGARRDALGCAE